jgi:hypothetical protein
MEPFSRSMSQQGRETAFIVQDEYSGRYADEKSRTAFENRKKKPRRRGEKSGGAGLQHGPLKLVHGLTPVITSC